VGLFYISKTMSVHQCPAVGLAELECLPAVDSDVAAGSLMSVDVQPSSAVGLVDLECLLTVLFDVRRRPAVVQRTQDGVWSTSVLWRLSPASYTVDEHFASVEM